MSRARTALLFVLGLALEVAAFPPLSLWPLAFLMLAPLAAYAAVERPARVFAFAWAQQAVAALLLGHWLVHALVTEYEAPLVPGLAFIALMIGAYALLPAAAAALFARLRDRVPPALLALHFGALYVLTEWLRAEPLGLPWLLAAQPLTAAPILVQGAELGSAYLPGLCAAALGAGLGIAAVRRTAVPIAAPSALLLLTIVYGAVRLAAAPAAAPRSSSGVVQAAVPQRERFRPGSALRNTQRHIELTQKLTAAGPVDLIVWSETSIDDDLDAQPGLQALLRYASAQAGAPIVTGAPRSAGGRRTNAVLEIDGGGIRASYDKQKLVPFAESIRDLRVPRRAPRAGDGRSALRRREGHDGLPRADPVRDADLLRDHRPGPHAADARRGRPALPEPLERRVVRPHRLRGSASRPGGAPRGRAPHLDRTRHQHRHLRRDRPGGPRHGAPRRRRRGNLPRARRAAWPATPYARAGSIPIVVLLAAAATGSPLRLRRRPAARSTAGRRRSGPGRRGGRPRA